MTEQYLSPALYNRIQAELLALGTPDSIGVAQELSMVTGEVALGLRETQVPADLWTAEESGETVRDIAKAAFSQAWQAQSDKNDSLAPEQEQERSSKVVAGIVALIKLGWSPPMDFDAWRVYGMEQEWAGPPVCSTHDGIPMTEEEDEEFEESDPCIHIIRLYEDPRVKTAVEENHSPSVWRK